MPGCTGARVRGRELQGGARVPGARRQGVVQVAAGAESTPYLDFRPSDWALHRRQVSTRVLCVARLGDFALGGARGRAALGASRLPRAAAAAAAAATAAVAAAVLGGVVEQTAQAHCGGRGGAPTQTRGVRPGSPRQFDLRAVPPPRPGPGHQAKWATRGGGRESPRLGLPSEHGVGGGGGSSVPFPRPQGTEGLGRLGTLRAKLPLPGMRG